MSSIVISGDTSGAITLAVPAVSGTNTATLPAATGTVMVSGNMPAFSAYATSSQTVTAGTATKILFDAERFDTNNNFLSSRFTPTIAGYYLITAAVCFANNTAGDGSYLMIYKNSGCVTFSGSAANAGTYSMPSISQIIYLNGSTDFVEIYTYQAASVSKTTSLTTFGTNDGVTFTGAMIRAA